jgi:sortase A
VEEPLMATVESSPEIRVDQVTAEPATVTELAPVTVSSPDGARTRSLPQTRRRRRPVLSPVQTVLVGVCLVVVALSGWFALYLTVLSGAVEAHSQASLYSEFREQLAEGTVALGGAVDAGAPVALLNFPSAGLADTVIAEGTTSGELMAGPGHRRDTVLPGQVGVSVVYGRQMAFGGPFRSIDSGLVGRTFTVTTGQGVFTYMVDRIRHAGDPLPQPLAAGASRLTLVTAEPTGTGRLARFVPQSEVFLDATVTGKAAPRQAQVGAVPTSEQAMQGDPSVLPLVLLWMQLLLLTVGAAIWAWFRWGRPQTWLVAGAVGLAALWGLSGAVAQLLPNLL